MKLLNSKALKVEFLKGLEAKRYFIEDILKDNFLIFKNSEDEYEVMNCRTKKMEIMNSRLLKEWQIKNTGKGRHQVILYVL